MSSKALVIAALFVVMAACGGSGDPSSDAGSGDTGPVITDPDAGTPDAGHTDLSNGIACTLGKECASGFCTDGVCCESSCAGSCMGCNVSGSVGVCVPYANGSDPEQECGGALTCGGDGRCLTRCTGHAQCEAGHYCENGACLAKASNGIRCTSDVHCTSGICVDGLCCNTECDGTCEACHLTGSRGTCTPIATGADPANECPGVVSCDGARHCRSACTSSSQCGSDGRCVDGLCVAKLAIAATCNSNEDCDSSHCVDGVCCQTACDGTCSTCALEGGEGTCRPATRATDPDAECPGAFSCDGNGACMTACREASDCENGLRCVSGSCEPREDNGAACVNDDDCLSSVCVDGVCCNTACDGTCEACDNAGSVGTCSPIKAETDPDAECPGALTCNGTDGCFVTCTDTNCEEGFTCIPGLGCVVRRANAMACSYDFECASGACVFGMCCSQHCGGCRRCDLPGSIGTCTNVPANTYLELTCADNLTCDGAGSCRTSCTTSENCAHGLKCWSGRCEPVGAPLAASCSSDIQCASGHCTEGVCCETSCDGACSSCLNLGAIGQCTPIAPGRDPKSACNKGLTCDGRGFCMTSCITTPDCEHGYFCENGACKATLALGAVCTLDEQCASDICVDGVCCDSPCFGTCVTCNQPNQAKGTCSPVIENTDPAGECGDNLSCNGTGRCRLSCDSDVECDPGYYCTNGACVALQSNGSACSADGECASGHCFDQVCCETACDGECVACNLDSGHAGTCTSIPADTDPASECLGALTCNGVGACRSNCVADAQCEGGFFCNVVDSSAPGTCETLLANGAKCVRDTQCANHICVDGRCCESACDGSCEACGNDQGECRAIPADADPASECAGGLTCSGLRSCRVGCITTDECEAGTVCNGITCLPTRSLGQSCFADVQCPLVDGESAGVCLAGVCCEARCAACSSCDGDGRCVPDAENTDPRLSCSDGFTCDGQGACFSACSSEDQCNNDHYCDLASSKCAFRRTNGSTCTTALQCMSDQCVDGVCCESTCDGTCRSCALPGTEGQCTDVPALTDPDNECPGHFTCDGNQSCLTSCMGPAQCQAGFICIRGACVEPKSNGVPCVSTSDCTSGLCIDGFCCNAACDGLCEACDVSGSIGTCSPILANEDPLSECTGPLTCDGAGGCRKDCSVTGHCEYGFICSAGQCMFPGADGSTCTVDNECTSGICKSGECGCAGTTTLDVTNPCYRDPPACVPLSCEALGRDCGERSDGCGGTIDCGSCESPAACLDNLCVPAGDTTPPTVTITSPVDGDRFHEPRLISISASDDIGVSRVDLLVDGNVIASAWKQPFSVPIDARTLVGVHVLKARAYDAAGLSADSAEVTVTIGMTLKVLNLVYDPFTDNSGTLLRTQKGWNDPAALLAAYGSEVESVSGGFIKYEVAETRTVHAWPPMKNGFFMNASAYELCSTSNTVDCSGVSIDYDAVIDANDIDLLVMSGDIDEVFVWGGPGFGLSKPAMAGPGAYRIGGITYPFVQSGRAFPIMSFDYSRGVSGMLEQFGHRIEATMTLMYGSWALNQAHAWNRFTSIDLDQTGLGGIGTVNCAVNALQCGLDRSGTRTVSSSADDWFNYPNLTGARVDVSVATWRTAFPNREDDHAYLLWWLQHLPRADGRGTDGRLNNWWRYAGEIDTYKSHY